MPKKSSLIQIKKINKKKFPLPVSRMQKFKRWVNRYMFFKRLSFLVAGLAAMLITYHFQNSELGYLFKASVLETPLPFNGTIYPVEKIPDWSRWNGDHYTTHFSDISSSVLTSLPAYDLNKLQFPSEELVWGNPDHNLIRNAKITYSVVYLGNYTFNHTEYSGSHPAVDIRMPVGTPVRSIANGRVVKASMQGSGFGHHVVILHPNVPSLEDPNKKVNLYSGFNHMDEIHVKEGQVVKKGEIIGTSGNTGTSTTPHLHFQIDTEDAPFKPYWPFSWTESQQAGLSFFDAVNAGLGQENGKKYTINPMKYVSQYLDYSGIPADSDNKLPANPDPVLPDSNTKTNDPLNQQKGAEPASSSANQGANDDKNSDINSQTVNLKPAAGVDVSLTDFTLSGERVGLINNGILITATIRQTDLEKMSDGDEVQVNLSGVGRVSKKTFRKTDFKNNAIQFIVNSSEAGTANISVGRSTHKISFIEKVKPIAALEIETDGYFQKNQVETIRIIALDEDRMFTPVANFPGLIQLKAKEGEAVFSPDQLSSADFKNGVAVVRMTAGEAGRIIIRAQSGAIIGESKALYPEKSEIFTDISPSHPHYEAIRFLKNQGVINGYADGSFKANKPVDRVEALKMLMLAFNVETDSEGALPFRDTDENAWYASTLATAVSKGIVKGYDDGTFKPAQHVKISEYLKMLFETNDIEPGTDLAVNPYDDVPRESWYSGYAYLTRKKNLMDVSGNRLNAAQDMTRGQVAETIYRLHYVMKNNLVSYAK